MTKKQCCRCKQTKGLNEFYKQANGSLGRTGACKECRKAKQVKWNAQNIEQKRESYKRYYINNTEKIAAKNKEWVKKNPDYFRERRARLRDSQSYT